MCQKPDDSVRAVVDAVGTQPATAFRRAGWVGVFSVVARLAFCLVIPLVSWAGPAVVERAVNAFLG